MAQLAFFSMVASLSLAFSALLALGGMPSQLPITGAAAASAAMFGAVYAACRRRVSDQAGQALVREPEEPTTEASGEEQELVAAR